MVEHSLCMLDARGTGSSQVDNYSQSLFCPPSFRTHQPSLERAKSFNLDSKSRTTSQTVSAIGSGISANAPSFDDDSFFFLRMILMRSFGEVFK